MEAAAGITPGSADYEMFFIAWQSTFESADPINWAGELSRHNNVVLHEVMGDEFARVYSAVKRTEYEEFLQVISPWEREHLLLNV